MQQAPATGNILPMHPRPSLFRARPGSSALRVVLLLVAMIAGGCASVPWSTLLQLRQLDEQRWSRIDPAEIRVRVTLPPEFVVDAEGSHLQVRLDTRAGSSQSRLQLQEIGQHRRQSPAGLLRDSRVEQLTEYRLTDAAQLDFARLQTLAARGAYESSDIEVKVRFAETPDDTREAELTVEVQLFAAEGYFTLIDAYTLQLDAR